MMKKLWLTLALTLLSLLILTACVSQPPEDATGDSGTTESTDADNQASADGGGTLVIAYDRDAETLDHIKTSDYHNALVYIFDRLVIRDQDFNFHPSLAKEWEVSDDGLTWTFYLKENVKFHDGSELTAHDVKWTFDTIKDPEVGSPAMNDFEPIKEVIAEDDHTVVIKLENPYPNLLFRLSNTVAGIMSKDAYEKYGDEYGTKYVIGTGPFKLKEWVQGDKIVLEKNEEYDWGPDFMENNGKPQLDEIVMKIIPEENLRLMELEVGNVHIVRDLTPTMIDSIKDNEDIEIFTGGAPRLGYLAYATDKEPFNDVRVRRAINHAINKQEIVDHVFRGYAEVAHGYLPPVLTEEYYPDSEKISYEYDVEKAKELLKEAGYEDGLKFTLAAENASNYGRIAEVLQAQLKEVGIETKIQMYESSSYTDMLKDGQQELFLRMYGWQNADILDWFLNSKQFPYPNHSRWQDEKTDQMIQEAESMPTWEERVEKYHELQKYLIEQAVWAPIYIPSNSVAVRKEVENFKYDPIAPKYQDGVRMKTN